MGFTNAPGPRFENKLLGSSRLGGGGGAIRRYAYIRRSKSLGGLGDCTTVLIT